MARAPPRNWCATEDSQLRPLCTFYLIHASYTFTTRIFPHWTGIESPPKPFCRLSSHVEFPVSAPAGRYFDSPCRSRPGDLEEFEGSTTMYRSR